MSEDRAQTGISGLDDLLNGGIPRGRVVLVMGDPGSGKTTLCTQFLVNGIQKFNENGVMVTLEESPEHMCEEMGEFGWNLEEMENSGKLKIVDASPIRKLPGDVKLGKITIGKREFSMITLADSIKKNAEEIKAKRIMVDGMNTLIFQFPNVDERRNAILELIQTLASTGATCLIVTELKTGGVFERIVQDEEYLSHGVILMQTVKIGKTFTRAIQVEKMRRTAVDNQPRPYRITKGGIEVFSKESVF